MPKQRVAADFPNFLLFTTIYVSPWLALCICRESVEGQVGFVVMNTIVLRYVVSRELNTGEGQQAQRVMLRAREHIWGRG